MLALGLHEREVCCYGVTAPRLGGPVAPRYHPAADTTTGVFDLLLGDAGPAVDGDEITGATSEQGRLGVEELGRARPADRGPGLAEAPWLNRESPHSQAMTTPLHAGFVDRRGDQIEPGHRVLSERLVGSFDGYLAQESERGRIQGLVHGDYRLDDILFGAEGDDRASTVVDWQIVSGARRQPAWRPFRAAPCRRGPTRPSASPTSSPTGKSWYADFADTAAHRHPGAGPLGRGRAADLPGRRLRAPRRTATRRCRFTTLYETPCAVGGPHQVHRLLCGEPRNSGRAGG